MSRILIVTMLAIGPALLSTAPAAACHPPPLPDLGCPHMVDCPQICCPPLPPDFCEGR